MKSVRLLAGAATLMLLTSLTACGAEPEAPVATEPDAPAGIAVSDAWLALPAVSGNPGAVYFTISNASDRSATIRAADMLGAASAMMHETTTWNMQTDMQELIQLPVPAGEDLVFAPGGKHVMVFDLDESLAVGGETEMTLTFAGGDKVSFPVAIRAAGDDGSMDDMSGM